MEANMQPESEANWFVGAYWDEDQTPRFCKKGFGRTAMTTNSKIPCVQCGRGIGSRSSLHLRAWLGMAFHSITVAKESVSWTSKRLERSPKNLNDGKRVRVNWSKQYSPRKWYFYTHTPTVWHVKPGEWWTDALLAFAFNGEPQDMGRFIDIYLPTDKSEDEAAGGDEDSGKDGQDHESTDEHITISVPAFHEVKEQIEKSRDLSA